MSERLETSRLIAAPAADIFALLRDPQGRVAIDSPEIHPDRREAGILLVLSENALRGTLGILDRTVRRGYPR
jgi:hypothetical protein